MKTQTAFYNREGEIPISLDSTPRTEKPKCFGEINEKIKLEFVTPEQLKECIEQGMTFTPAVFEEDGKRLNESFTAQQLIALDFDKETSLTRFNQVCHYYNLKPLIIYRTFSSTPHTLRFRAIFKLDVVLIEKRFRDFIVELFHKVFWFADANTKDAARLFFGTNQEVIFFDPLAGNVFQVFVLNYLSILKLSDSNNYDRNLKTLLNPHQILLKDGLSSIDFETCSQISIEESDARIIYILIRVVDSSDLLIETVSCEFEQVQDQKKTHLENTISENDQFKIEPQSLRQLKENDLERFKESCSLFNDFHQGKEITHESKMMFLSNLIPFRSGEKLFFSMLENSEDYKNQKGINFNRHAQYIKKRNYSPWSCEKGNCPYLNSCNRQGCFPLNQVQRITPGKVEVIHSRKKPMKTLTQSQKDTQTAIEAALADTQPNVHLILVDPGVGKTHVLLEQDLNTCCVSTPNHKLKEELIKRSKQPFYIWPRRPELKGEYKTALKHVEDISIGSVIPIYKEFLNDPCVFHDPEKEAEIKTYLLAFEEIKKAQKVICSHDKAFILENDSINTFVFDECLVESLFKVKSINATDFNEFRNTCAFNPDFQSLEAFVEQLNSLHVGIAKRGFKDIVLKPELLKKLIGAIKTKVHSPVLGIMAADAIVKDWNGDVLFIQKRKIQENKKYVVLSATSDPEVYKHLFSDRLVLHDLRGTQLQGKLIQHVNRSFSRTDIQKNPQAFKDAVIEAVTKFDLNGIITFKQFVKEREEKFFFLDTDIPVFTWFGNVNGFDGFQGNLGVFGTPHQTGSKYSLFSCLLTNEDQKTPTTFSQKQVERNEFRFFLMSPSTDPQIQQIQQWLVESELIQAVHRARLTRNACQVHLFSNFPIPNAEIVSDSKKLTTAKPLA